MRDGIEGLTEIKKKKKAHLSPSLSYNLNIGGDQIIKARLYLHEQANKGMRGKSNLQIICSEYQLQLFSFLYFKEM